MAKTKRRKQRSKRRTKIIDVTKYLKAPKPKRTTTTTSTTYVTAPGVMQYPREEDVHAVTTNQEPPAQWPDVGLPVLTGFTVTPGPVDNDQANPDTIFTPATTEVDPYNDYNTNNSSSGAGDMYPGGVDTTGNAGDTSGGY